MKISNCCGDTGTRRWYHSDTQFIDHGICGECGEMCEYIEEDNTEPKDADIIGEFVDVKPKQ